MFGRQKNIDQGPIDRIDDAKSFEKVYTCYWRKVYTVCYNNTGEKEVAREMVQDIFKSLWERRAELQFHKSIEHYLLRAAKLKVFEFLRNKTSHKKHIECILQDYCEATNCTEDEISYNGLLEKVNLLVDRLPCQCRNVYKMSKEQGLSNKEIASALLISERAVEYHITRAFNFFRQNLQEYRS